jgi:hypothetical protein
MAYERTGYAPWSLTREAGVQSATVDGTIKVPQYIQPTLDTGFVDEKGNWKGVKSSDEQFNIMQTDTGVANTAAILTPSTNADGTWPLDMTGYSDLFIAIKPTNAGDYATEAVMGPASTPFANLKPVNAAAILRGTISPDGNQVGFGNAIVDSSESLTADVWNIFFIGSRLKEQKLLQFKITNNSGNISTIETAFMRIV